MGGLTVKSLRIVRQGKTFWFVGRDVLTELGYSPTTKVDRVIADVPLEWKGLQRVMTAGGAQEMWCLTAQGLQYIAEHTCRPLTEELEAAVERSKVA